MDRIKLKSGSCKEPGCRYKGRLIAGKCQSHYWKSRNKIKPLKIRQPTGEKKLFEKLWEQREHRSELNFESITAFNVGNFHHILPKSRYPAQRLDPENVIILTLQQHDLIHRIARSDINDKIFNELWRRESELKKKVREFETQYTEII